MQIIIRQQDVNPFKKGQVFTPEKIGYFMPDPTRLTAKVLLGDSYYWLDQDSFDIKIKKAKRYGY